jgi:DNA-binding HxlR family transcriptional regulator
MRTYGQFCALAKALDVIGDRWTLLIVREIMARGAARFTDLRNGLPGIASNLLADRLRELEAADVIKREEAPPPVATTLYALTERGNALRPVLRELGRWGAPMLTRADKSDEIRGYWIGLPVELYVEDAEPAKPPVSLEVRTGEEPVTLTIGGDIRSSIGCVKNPDAVISGPAHEILRVLLGRSPLSDAVKRGVTYKGDRKILGRLRAQRAF